MAVTFLHTGDLHLGSPLRAISGTDEAMGQRLARATQESFRRVVTEALDREVDFVVVAGDLYDREARSVKANEFLREQFQRLADGGIPAFVVHGNHDPVGSGPDALDLPDATHVFGSDEVECIPFPDAEEPQARVLGRSYGARHESNKLYYHYSPPDRTVPSVGLLHTGLNPDGRRYAPCGPEDLASKDIDYWALGHIHQTEVLDGAPGAYCGIPQGRHVGEEGLGGCLQVTLETDEPPDVEFVPTSPIVWQRVTIDVGEAAQGEEATNASDAENGARDEATKDEATKDEATSDEATAESQSLRNLTDLEGFLADRGLELRTSDVESLVAHDVPLAANDWEPQGFVCRWELTGRGEIHAVLDDAEAIETLADRLRSRLDDTTPFVWTAGVRDLTGPPIPDRETLAAEDDVLAELISMTDEFQADPEVRADLREEAGEVWEWVEDRDREETPPDRLALDPAKLDELLEQALETALGTLATKRNHVD